MALHKRNNCKPRLKPFSHPNGFFLLTKYFNLNTLYKYCINLVTGPRKSTAVEESLTSDGLATFCPCHPEGSSRSRLRTDIVLPTLQSNWNLKKVGGGGKAKQKYFF